jgi:hypothetical protein
MKTFVKPFLVALVLFLFGFKSHAQYLQFSVFADPQLSWFTSDTKRFSPNGPVFGFNAGFSFERYFADRYAISSGASISSIGGNLKYNEEGYMLKTRDGEYPIAVNSNVRVKGQYINVPLGLKFKTNEIGYTTFYAHLGIIGHLKLKGFAWQDEAGVDKEVLEKEQLHFGFVSYMFGAGMQYSLGGPSAIQVGITYASGMTPVYDAGYGMISLGDLSLRLGLVF